MAVSKGVLGEPQVVQAMIRGGISMIADSRIENIQRLQQAGITATFVLLRTALSQAPLVVQYVDISLNTEIEIIQSLGYHAGILNRTHQVILMVEMGDLREGILPQDLFSFIRQVLAIDHINIIGFGCNLACYGGVKPDESKMEELSQLVELAEAEFNLELQVISGGNSANYEWFQSAPTVGRINNLRIGEAILLGCEALHRNPIPGLSQNAFQLVGEVIESKRKPSKPYGEICQDAFGQTTLRPDHGEHQRVIVALGRQDLPVESMTPPLGLEVLGASSDHTILACHSGQMHVGEEVRFQLNYAGLLATMTSPFITKRFV